MQARRAAFLVFSMAAATGAWACGGKGNLFATSGAGSGGGGSGSSTQSTGSQSTGTLSTVGSGGAGGQGSGSTTVSGTATSTGTGTASSTGSTGSSGYPASFPPPPQVVSGGGPVLAHPKLYPVFFQGDDPTLVASLTDFTQKVGATPYWTATTSEYGVGAATGEPAIQLAEAAPGTIDDTAIQTWLAQKFAAGAPFPAPDDDTLMVLYYPSGTTITLQGATSCQTFGGYHNSATVGGQQVAYAVLPRCGATMGTVLDTVTSAASHELIEGSTDPNPETNPAYVQVDEEDFYWQLLFQGGEVGDMCAQLPNVFTTFPPFPYVVQRTWSNLSAQAGRDPCVPELPGEVYVNAAPVMSDMATLSVQGQTVMVKSVQIPVGQSRTIPVDLFSEGPVSAPWTVQGVDPAPMLGSPQLLDLSVTPSTGENGDVAMVTIKVLQAGPGNVELFYLTSTQGSQQGIWVGLVSN
jgi:hypothetical protein